MWFSTTDVPDAAAFARLIGEDNIEKLERAGGLCIVSTHLGKGFVKDGVLHPQFEKIIQKLSSRPGWYVPVADLLDYLVQRQGKGQELGWWKTFRLETRFLLDKVLA